LDECLGNCPDSGIDNADSGLDPGGGFDFYIHPGLFPSTA
jgi:hypothetical protein